MTISKIVFGGPDGAGKAASIAAISDIPPFSITQMQANGASQDSREQTSQDYGIVKLDNGNIIHLHSTGDNATRKPVNLDATGGVLGMILVIDNSRPDPLWDLMEHVETYRTFINETGLAIGVTASQNGQGPKLDEFFRCLKEQDLEVPVFEIDCKNSHDIAILIEALMCTAALKG